MSFATHTAQLSTGVTLAYVREGIGGYPLLLIHGYPMTKRIWWRNIAPLAAAGFDVIVPDLRGYGESSLAADGYYDPAAHTSDLHALMTEELGIARCAVAGGDLGGVVAIDMALRFPALVERLCLFNTTTPSLPEAYAAAGIAKEPDWQANPLGDYAIRQGTAADALLAELDTPEKRRRYIAEFYGHRLWCPPTAFTPDEVAFMTEPFADAARLRASWVDYEVVCGTKEPFAPERLSEPVATPTLVLYGPDDQIEPRSFPAKCAVAFSTCIGPFVVPHAGHYLPWEQTRVFNSALIWFLADRRATVNH